MHVHRHGVHAERIGDQVQQLTSRPDRMRSPQPERVVQMPVDALGVVATLVEGFEVRIPRWDLTNVLGPIELEILGLAHHNSVSTYLRRYEDLPRPILDLPNSRIRLWLRQDIMARRKSRNRT